MDVYKTGIVVLDSVDKSQKSQRRKSVSAPLLKRDLSIILTPPCQERAVTALFQIIRRTKMGRAMVAISQDAGAAALMGINVNRISALSLGIGSALAAIAGGLMGTLLQLTPFMGTLAIT